MSRNRPHIPEPLRKLARAAADHGWRISVTSGGHLRWTPPDGPAVYTPSTPNGGKRSISNCRAELKRAGLNEEAS